MNSAIVHYQEIALKGRNRPFFIGRLVRNLRIATRGLGVSDVRPLMGRIELLLEPGADWPAIRERLAETFGVANFAKAGRTGLDLDGLAAAILRDLGDVDVATFRVSARRADKRFPLTSPQVEREVGGRIKAARGWRVDLSAPELVIRLEILTGEAFYFFGKDRGPGGLPIGVSGRVACLLSGGIDSPVAAFRMMRRGCPALLVHFHSYPLVSRASQEKVQELARVLTRYQYRTRLSLVPFGDIQRKVILSVPPRYRVIIYRRLMVRIATELGRGWGAQALVTGEVVGQVASQTLENLSVIDGAAGLPILRPLIGMDKDEIVAEAQRLGTYGISIVPDEDCCQLFTPKHPATRSTAAEIELVEQALDLPALVQDAVTGVETLQLRFPEPSPAPSAPGDSQLITQDS